MAKRKCLIFFLFCLTLCYSLPQYTARVQSSSIHSQGTSQQISSQGQITQSPLNVNLAVIPDGWHINQYPNIKLDYNVAHTPGSLSIRLEPSPLPVNPTRECDGNWYSIRPGDHIVAKVWIKVGLPAGYTHQTDPYQIRGARLGIDLLVYTVADGYLHIVDGFPTGHAPLYTNYVEWGTTSWVQEIWDFQVPSTFYTYARDTSTTIAPTQISQFVPWLQAEFATDAANAWFADAELYINP